MAAKRFKQCLLHIGTEKTGTTTLQDMLGANRASLAQRGYFVPQSLSPSKSRANHRRLTSMFLAIPKVNDALRRAEGVTDEDGVIAHRASVKSAFEQELARRDDDAETLLLSNEHLQSRLVDPSEVAELRAFLGGYAETFQVLVYLRPQHELAISAHSQAMKAGRFDIDLFPDFAKKKVKKGWVRRSLFDYAELTARWGEAFGRDTLKPRIFDRKELVNGSVVDDFLLLIGCPPTDLVIPENTNRAIPADVQPALNAVNRLARLHPEKLDAKTRLRLLSAMEGLTGRRVRPARAEIAYFLSMFEASNEVVRETYFPDRDRLFAIDLDSYPEQAEPLPSEAEALIQMLRRVLPAPGNAPA